jgi:hypothetical protein
MSDTADDYAVTIAAGEYVFRQGEAGNCAFVVETGDIVLSRDKASGEQVAERLGPGDVFGESALVRDAPREVSARAQTAATLLRIEGASFGELVAGHPEIAARLIGRLSLRLSRARQPPGPSTGTARLVHVSGAEFPLPSKGVALVGRADPHKHFTPEVELSSLDAMRSLSRRHARLLKEGDVFYVQEEPQVRNGTFVNGRRLKPGERLAVADGDEIAFGLIKTTFRLG